MKKQNFQKKLTLKSTRISNLSTIYGGNVAANVPVGGDVPVRFTENPCYITDMNTCQTVKPCQEPKTQAIRCGHTIGNGQDTNGNPCTY
ncbi:MAG: hypothetical protein AAF617_07555 [Bacteroidota bacterium]